MSHKLLELKFLEVLIACCKPTEYTGQSDSEAYLILLTSVQGFNFPFFRETHNNIERLIKKRNKKKEH